MSEGCSEGTSDGNRDGMADGSIDGWSDGTDEGTSDGSSEDVSECITIWVSDCSVFSLSGGCSDSGAEDGTARPAVLDPLDSVLFGTACLALSGWR